MKNWAIVGCEKDGGNNHSERLIDYWVSNPLSKIKIREGKDDAKFYCIIFEKDSRPDIIAPHVDRVTPVHRLIGADGSDPSRNLSAIYVSQWHSAPGMHTT